MLAQLFIQNFAIIQKAHIDFTEGLNVFTGETGAGKSILIGAINAALGERTNKDIIRAGENKASVSAVFSCLPLEIIEFINQCGFEMEQNDELLISRDITLSSNTCRINGKPATVALLKHIGAKLVNIHGQHDNHMLFSGDNHRKIVDVFGNYSSEIEKYQKVYKQYKKICSDIDALSLDEKSKAHKMDLLSYQINEIQVAELDADGFEEIKTRREVIRNSSKLTELLGGVFQLLHGDDENIGIVDMLDEVSTGLEETTKYMDSFEDKLQSVVDYRYELDDIALTVKDALEELEYDPKELDEIEERLDVIHRLQKKYGNSIVEILQYCEKAQQELDDITFSDKKLEKLERERKLLYLECSNLAGVITSLRKMSAQGLISKVEEQLSDLDMKSVKLSIMFTTKPFSENGVDDVEFLIVTNKGEQAKSLSKIASGGELARIMLAIKAVTTDEIGTMIFDEVDTGVSGRSAQKIGLKMRQIGNSHQVICVTHLSQVAVYSHNHLLISKHTDGERTYTDITTLDKNSKINEIARINSGENITALSINTAKEMLDIALSETC